MKGGRLGRGNKGKLGRVCRDISFWREGVEWSVATDSGMLDVEGRVGVGEGEEEEGRRR